MLVRRMGGHITLLFTIDKQHRLPRSQGSTGAGFSIAHGVEIKGSLTLPPSPNNHLLAGSQPDPKPIMGPNGAINITVRDRQGSLLEDHELYLDYIEACRDASLLPNEGEVELDINIECPTSQGFGMSAAGLMALGEVIHQLTGKGSRVQYLKIAHRIERKFGSGLGDVLGASVGGVERREHPGAPGWPGKASSFQATADVLLVWDGNVALHTSDYINHPGWEASITAAGEEGMLELNQGPWTSGRWGELLKQAHRFSKTSGMLEEPVRAILHERVASCLADEGAEEKLDVHLCMLGNSVAVLPQSLDESVQHDTLLKIAHQLEKFGYGTLVTNIAPITQENLAL